METIKIREYGAFCEGKEKRESPNGYVSLKRTTFALLERFVLENNRDGEDGSLEIMSLSARRGIGKIITVKNYVGIISLNDGTVIEILPKIYSEHDEADSFAARRLLVRMLNTLYNVSYKNLQTADLDVCKMNVLEVFIRMFVDEVLSLTKQGLKSSYETLEDNLSCFKGKIQFSKHIRHNFAHKERVYVSYDEFTINRPENKLLKSTLAYLYPHAHSQKNKKDIKNLLALFEGVDLSTNYDADFSKIITDRNTKAYTTSLNWAKVFLKGKSFTSFSGSTASMALLFPMEKLFECYIATLLGRELTPKGCTVSTQDRGYYLFDSPKKFSLRPDIVVKDNGGNIYILDTKWKLLNSNPSANYGISQSDMYQMYAYQQKYSLYNSREKVKGVTLIYPKTKEYIEMPDFSADDVNVQVKFVDMSKSEKSIEEISKEICQTTI